MQYVESRITGSGGRLYKEAMEFDFLCDKFKQTIKDFCRLYAVDRDENFLMFWRRYFLCRA